MNRPTQDTTYDTFMLKTSWVSPEGLEPVAIEAKGYHYPLSNKAFLEVRHLLDVIYKDSTVKYNIKDFLKNNKNKFVDIFELCEESWETCVIPSLKAWTAQRAIDETLRPSPYVRQEWTINMIGTMGALLHMGLNRREGNERDRAKAMLTGILSELAFIEDWTYECFMNYLDRARSDCADLMLGATFCYHVNNDLGDWMTRARIVWWRQKMFPCVSSFPKIKFLKNTYIENEKAMHDKTIKDAINNCFCVEFSCNGPKDT